MNQSNWLWVPLTVALSMGTIDVARSIEPVAIEFLWQSEPALEFQWFKKPSAPYVEINLAHLNSAAARDRMQVTQSILRVPHSTALNRSEAIQILLKRLKAGEPERLVRLEMIAAVCELDSGEHAAQLWALAKGDDDAERIVQRACIDWHSAEPAERWRKSLSSRTATEQDLLDAVEGLGVAGKPDDAKQLETLVMDATRSPAVRLHAARAIGNLSTDTQMPLAQQLFSSSATHGHLLAVEVLAKSPAASCSEFVQQIAVRSEPLAQRAAYKWLCAHDVPAAQRLIADMSKHADSEIRLLVLNQIASADNDQTLPQLFAAFGDVNPNVRSAARVHVLDCCTRSDKSLQTALTLLKPALDTDDWKSLEQLTRLTVELKQPAHCERLITLMDHPRAEVCITACWALRHLAEDEAILARMLAYVNHLTQLMLEGNPVVTDVQHQCIAHLFEAFGQRKYEPARQTALKYVPKNFGLGLITRMTAVWACGKLWERSENKALCQQLHERIADKASQFPETYSLRFAATLALGWIADPDSREPLIKNDEGKPTAIGYATEWALQRIQAR